MTAYEVRRGDLCITTARERIDVNVVERFLRESYWAGNRSRERIERSMEHSLCFGVLRGAELIAFARVVTDRADFAWLCDVYVDVACRGEGIGTWLVRSVLDHPDVQGLRRWILATRDAHELYARFGFHSLASPDRWMER